MLDLILSFNITIRDHALRHLRRSFRDGIQRDRTSQLFILADHLTDSVLHTTSDSRRKLTSVTPRVDRKRGNVTVQSLTDERLCCFDL